MMWHKEKPPAFTEGRCALANHSEPTYEASLRLWEIVGREGHSARYNAGTWLSMMLNWHDMHS